MKIVFLGYGVAGQIFNAVASKYFPALDVTFITKDIPSNVQDFGLRYLHPKNDALTQHSIYDFIVEETGSSFAVNTTIEIDYMIRSSHGWHVAKMLDTQTREDIVKEYCETNFRHLSTSTMNSFVSNPYQRRAAINYKELMTLITENGKCQNIVLGNIYNIDVDRKRVSAVRVDDQKHTYDMYEFSYDVIISSIPLYALDKIMGMSKTQYTGSDALFVRSNTVVDTRLLYFYNTAKLNDMFNLSRCTFKHSHTDFEFSINPQSSAAIEKDAVTKAVIDILKELAVFLPVDWSLNNSNIMHRTHLSHFKQSDDTKFVIELFKKHNIFMLGRYAQWDPSIKLPDMWDRAYSLLLNFERR